jgi:CheY-like chemotaxis protein
LERLRATPGGAGAAVLLLTTLRLRAGAAQAVGAAGAIMKPFRPAPLLETLVRALTGAAAQDKRAPAASPFGDTLASRLPLRLLLADDNAVNQKVASMLLLRLGYRADVAGNGVEVMRALQSKTYDLIFLDVQMPEMDGYETARRVTEQWAATPAARPRMIAMTGNAMQGDRERCLEAGMDDYISKPVRVDELRDMLERWGAPAVGGAAK